jgi:hypothetical protein
MYGFINGSAFSNPSAAIAFATGAARTNFGGNAGTPPPGNPWQGVVRHVMAIAGSSSVQDRQRMEGWLAWDCGLTGSLPANHPYKNARP